MPDGTHPPPDVIKAWFTDPDKYPHGARHGPELSVVGIIMFLITLRIVAARLWARVKIQKNAGLDDALIVAAMVPTAGMVVIVCLANQKYGADRHAWDMTPELAVHGRKLLMAGVTLWLFAMGLTKISILCFYRRLAAGSASKWFLRAVHASIAFVVAYTLAFLLALFFSFRPIDGFWNYTDPGWMAANKDRLICIDEGVEFITGGIISLTQDFIVCFLPLMITWRLQIRRGQKIALSILFSLGIVVCICGAFRVHELFRVFYHTYDGTWYAQRGWAFGIIEIDLAICCASAPALKIYWDRHVKKRSKNKGKRASRLTTSGFSRRSASKNVPQSSDEIRLNELRANGGWMV